MFVVSVLLVVMMTSAFDTVRIVRTDYNGSVLKSAFDGYAYDGPVDVVFGDTFAARALDCKAAIVGFVTYGFDLKRTPRPSLVDSLRGEAAAVGANLLVLDADYEMIVRQLHGPNANRPEGAVVPGIELPRAVFAAFALFDNGSCRVIRDEPSFFMSREATELAGELEALRLMDRNAAADTNSLIRTAAISAGVLQRDVEAFSTRRLAQWTSSKVASESESASWRQALINDSWAAVLEADDALVALSRAIAASDGGWLAYRLVRIKDIVAEIRGQLRADLEYAYSSSGPRRAPEAVR